ncbi:MAG: cytochrome c [Beijerinckiaceae bacterium]
MLRDTPARRSNSARAAVILAVLAGFAMLSTPSAALTPSETRGRDIAEKQCSPCHATGAKDVSKDKRAPALRTLAKRYPLENLEEAFAEGITVSHRAPEMPAFELDPEKITDLLAYLKVIGAR